MRRMASRIISVTVLVSIMAVGLLAFAPQARAQTVPAGVAVVNVSFLNVRAGPGTEWAVIGVTTGGSEWPVTGVSRNSEWLQVSTSFGSGWLFREFVLFRGDPSLLQVVTVSADAPGAQPTATVLAFALNVRSGPSTGFPILGVVEQGTLLTVIGRNPFTGWLLVQSPFGDGWVANSEVLVQGDTSLLLRITDTGTALAATSTSGSTSTALPGGVAVVNVAFLNVRSGAGTEWAVIGVVTGGTELPVVGVSNNREWWQVQSSFGTGWVFGVFTLFRGDPGSVGTVTTSTEAPVAQPTAIVLAAALNVRSGPSSGFPSLGSVPQGTVLTILGQHPTTGWFKVESLFGVGWVANGEVQIVGFASLIPSVTE